MAELATVSDDAARLRVLDAIRAEPGPFTVSDMVARTGLTPHEAERVLSEVVQGYESTLDVDEDGNLIYTFDPGLQARPDIVEADRKRRRKQALKRGAVAMFKAWTVVMVVVYAVIYALLFIAFMMALAAQQQNSDGRGRSRGPRLDLGRGLLWWHIFGRGGGRRYGRRRRGGMLRDLQKRMSAGEDPYDMKKGPKEAEKPSVIQRTWFFLFGTHAIERTPLEQERELITYVRAKRGLITNADIVALLGVPYRDADRIGTRLVATYDGEMDITDEGIAIYRFPNLMLSASEEVEGQEPALGYLWQVKAEEHALRSNPTVLIPALNLFNLVLCGVTWLKIIPFFGWTGFWTHLMLVGFPGLFSVLFFAVAGVRKLRESRAGRSYERDNLRISIYRLLFTRRRAVRVPGDEQQIAQAGLGSWNAARIAELAPAIAEELRGELHTEGNQLEIRAPRILEELSTVEKLRRGAEPTRSVGRTVFSSGSLEEQMSQLEAELA